MWLIKMTEQIGELITNRIIQNFYNNSMLAVFIMIIIYLFSNIILMSVLINKKHTFRINSEGIYSVLKTLVETVYIFSTALSTLLIILILSINNTLANMLEINWFSILGLIGLSFISLPYRIIFTERSNLLNIIDFFILISSTILIFTGIIFESLSYFNYIIN